MIELLPDWLERTLDVAEIHDPAGSFTDLSRDSDAHHEGMTVQTCALVPLGNVGKAMSCLECEFLEYFHD